MIKTDRTILMDLIVMDLDTGNRVLLQMDM